MVQRGDTAIEPGRRLACPRRQTATATAAGPLACVRCGGAIVAGELFFPTGRCAAGRQPEPVVEAEPEVPGTAGEHLRCAVDGMDAPDACCWTVGHGTRSLEELLALLHEHRIELLADIRTVPKSRHNPQSAGNALTEALPVAGLCYVHLPGLGGLRRPRADSPNDGWRNTSFRGYADYMLTSEFAAALAELIDLLRVRRTVIMCAETVYWRCHRSLVADALLIRGIPSLHLLGPGKATPHTLTRFAQPDGEQLLYPAEGS